MKYCILTGLLAALAGSPGLTAQQSNVSNATILDINGNRVTDGPAISQTKSGDGSQTLVTTQSINGRTVPMEQMEEHVLRSDSSGKVTERIIRRYDPQGNPLPPVRQTIEELKRPDGSSTIQSTTYSTDINGNSQISEKSVTDTQKNASGETSETVIQRPTVNGLEAVEKQSQVVTKQGDNFQAESTTYRRDGNGGFSPAVRQTSEHIVQGSQVSDSSAEYERDSYGEMALHGQTVTKTVTRPDGLKDSVVDIYSRNVPGSVPGSGSGLKLQEEQTIESTAGPGNSVVQTVSVRRPTVSDPGTLGPARQLSQTVCKGDCKPPKEAASKPAP
ncbi:MAG TPA: hypothetical protein VK708_18660 [Bryobacteraceae bacterium]|nr:hypothetical protein [Bryobacteraceae bacterium]